MIIKKLPLFEDKNDTEIKMSEEENVISEYKLAKKLGIAKFNDIVGLLSKNMGLSIETIEKYLKKAKINESSELKHVSAFIDLLDDNNIIHRKINADTFVIDGNLTVRVLDRNDDIISPLKDNKSADKYINSITAEYKDKKWFKDIDKASLKSEIENAFKNNLPDVSLKIDEDEYIYIKTDKVKKDFGFGISVDGTEKGIGDNSYTWLVINENKILHLADHGRVIQTDKDVYYSMNESIEKIIKDPKIIRVYEKYFSTTLEVDLRKSLKKMYPNADVKWRNKKLIAINGISKNDYDTNQLLIQTLNTYCVDGWYYTKPNSKNTIYFKHK